jgi:predicted transcriptional regulator
LRARRIINAQKYWEALEGANSALTLFALKEIGNSTRYELNTIISKEFGLNRSISSTRNRLKKLVLLGLVKHSKEKGRAKYVYTLTDDGNKMVDALEKFIEALE